MYTPQTRPIVEVFKYCPNCGGAHPLKYTQTFTGKIKATRTCCGEVVGVFRFPPMPHKLRKGYMDWLNGR